MVSGASAIQILPRIPLGEWIEEIYRFIFTGYLAGPVETYTLVTNALHGLILLGLSLAPPALLIIALSVVGFLFVGKVWGIGLVGGALTILLSIGLWKETLITVSMVTVAVLYSWIIGLPTGVIMANFRRVNDIVRPIINFMQTLPGYVYLIPAVVLLGLGVPPGVFATVLIAAPPTMRLVSVGIMEVRKDLVEMSKSFGATRLQTLFKIQFPLALPTIIEGLNETVLLSLTMVVFTAFIGATGLGMTVLLAISRLDLGKAFEGGLAIAFIAIIFDGLTKGFFRSTTQRPWWMRRRRAGNRPKS